MHESAKSVVALKCGMNHEPHDMSMQNTEDVLLKHFPIAMPVMKNFWCYVSEIWKGAWE